MYAKWCVVRKCCHLPRYMYACMTKVLTLKHYDITYIATCKIEDATKNEKVKVEPASSQYIQDDQVIIYCDTEYQMVNNSKPFVVRICLNNRVWSGTDPQCEKSEKI